jgi:CheY-like chemotaxis protein
MHSMLQRLVGEDVETRLSLCGESPTVRADPNQLEQALMNLAVNAKDAMPRGGRLLIETALVEPDGAEAASLPWPHPGRWAVLRVSDNGVGMDEATRRRIFEPFFTTEGGGEGSGLGLPMVQGIVVQSNGYIEVDSEPGRGTTFKVHLPALVEASTGAARPGAIAAQQGGETILIVEDQLEVREYAAAVLKAYGYRAIQAANADEALAIGERESARIHLTLTDVVMPRMSGWELADRLEMVRPGMRTMFMSGYTDNLIARQGFQAEGAHFIQKPFSPEELAGKVREVLGPSGACRT